MTFHIELDPATSRPRLVTTQRGRAVLLNPLTNKGTAFTGRERDALGLHGLLPPAVSTIEEQLERVYENYRQEHSDLDRFVFLTSLQDRNETLFFRLLLDHIDEMMPIVYTPTVGEACCRFSHIYRRARGLYVGYDQRERIEDLLQNYHHSDPSVIVVTDGERILGLGDQGVGGMGIPIGKLCLYTLCAGVSPFTTLPVLLDVGTNNRDRLEDPLYLGLRRERVRGEEYQRFVDRFVEAVRRVYPKVLVQWEDFLKANALHQLERFRDELCTFNDDIQGTAAVVVAGLLSGLRITGQSLRDQRVVIAGAGASAQGIAELLVSAFREQGLAREEARQRIYTTDSRGLVTSDREGLEPFKARFARAPHEVAAWKRDDASAIDLGAVIEKARPGVLIGTSASPGLFDERVVRAMARHHSRPMIFPLSNPTSKSECTPADALRWSEGRAIVATGSPFAPLDRGGRRYRIGQCNNAFIFPGIGLGARVAQARRVTDGMFLDAAHALARQVSERDLAETALYPELARIRECSHAVACAAARRAIEEGHAPEQSLDDLEERVRRAMWSPDYMEIRPA